MKPYTHKVNYYETDKMGITHHSNYIRFMEEARIYFLEQIGWSFEKLEAEGIGSPVISLTANYKKTTKFPDVIFIDIFVEKLSAFKLTFGYNFKVDGETVFTGTSSHCFLDEKGLPVMLEKRYPEMYAKFKEFLPGGAERGISAGAGAGVNPASGVSNPSGGGTNPASGGAGV